MRARGQKVAYLPGQGSAVSIDKWVDLLTKSASIYGTGTETVQGVLETRVTYDCHQNIGFGCTQLWCNKLSERNLDTWQTLTLHPLVVRTTIGQVMSDVQTPISSNNDDRGHIIYVSYVVFHAESKSEVRIPVSLLVLEIQHLTAAGSGIEPNREPETSGGNTSRVM